MITAMGLGTKQAPENVNLDPQSQFWSWLSAFKNPDELGDSGHHERDYFSGFACTQTSPAGMSIQIGGGDDVDSAAIFINSDRAVLLSTDGTPQKVTIPTAPASGSRIDAVVSYIDTSSSSADDETPGTPEYVHTIVVSGTASGSPTAPTDSQIVSALPAGANAKYYRWCDVRVAQGATTITNSNITDKKPASPNLYWTTSEIQGIARTIAQDEAEDVMTQSDNYSDITWYGVHMYIWRRGKIAGLWLDGANSIAIPTHGSEASKIPSWARPTTRVRAPLQFDVLPDYGGTAMVDPNGSFAWSGSSQASVGLWPSLNMSWLVS